MDRFLAALPMTRITNVDTKNMIMFPISLFLLTSKLAPFASVQDANTLLRILTDSHKQSVGDAQYFPSTFMLN